MRIVVAAVLLAGCIDVAEVHTCTSSADCILDGKQGNCEQSGFCSFADPTCGEDGFRYHEHAGDHANVCIASGATGTAIVGIDLAAEDDSIVTSCGPVGARDVFIEITTPKPQLLFVDTAVEGTNTPTALAVRTGSCPGTEETACSVNACGDLAYSRVGVPVEAGVHCIVVEQAAPASTKTVVGVRVIPSGRSGRLLGDLTPPVSGTTCGEPSTLQPSCATQPGSETAYVFPICPREASMPAGHVSAMVSPDPAGFDASLSLRAMAPGGMESACVDQPGTATEVLSMDLRDPGLYWLFVDRGSTAAAMPCGNYQLGFQTTQ